MYTKQIIKIFERYSSKSLILKMLGLSYCLCLSFLIAGSVVSASTPLVEWEKTFGGNTDDWGRSVYQTSDGGYIIAGYTLTRGGDIWLIKLDSKGNEEWDKNLGDMDWSEEEVYAVQQTKDGGYIVTGEDTKHNVPILKLDSNGNLVMERKLWSSARRRGSIFDSAN